MYDERPWIDELESLVRNIIDEDIPMLGVCFGHQVINSALGGPYIRGTENSGSMVLGRVQMGKRVLQSALAGDTRVEWDECVRKSTTRRSNMKVHNLKGAE